MENKKPIYVTTDSDLWNSADEAHFFVMKGQVKILPEVTTPIIEDALNQGLLREANKEEISKQEFINNIEKAVRERKILAGKTFDETVKNYQQYLNGEELKMVNDTEGKKPEEVKATETKKPEPEVKKPEPKKPETKEEKGKEK
jgi:TRAP-type mannitol/chloroaromatic compound transport system substrate-binding protein